MTTKTAKVVSKELAKTLAAAALGPKWVVKAAQVDLDGETLTFSAANKDDTIEIKGKVKSPPQEELPLEGDDDEDDEPDEKPPAKVTPIKPEAH